MVEKEPSSIDSVRRDGGIDAQAVDALGDALAVLIARQFDALVILIDRSGTLALGVNRKETAQGRPAARA